MGLTEFLANHITAFIDKTGYVSVWALMMMESMVLPVPSEAVMPFAGFLVAAHKFAFGTVILISTLGSIMGSAFSYCIGFYGGKPFIRRFGRFLLVNNEDLEKTERFFNDRGEITIFICRFIPVIRHLISIPAGTGRMNILKFSLYTVLGAGLWNSFLTVSGYFLRQNWDEIMKYSKVVDSVVLLLLVSGFVYFITKHLKRRSVGHSNGRVLPDSTGVNAFDESDTHLQP